MIIVRPQDQPGASGKVGSQFTGVVNPYITLPSTDGVVINTVSFNPCSRTFWHTHEGGQILFVISGSGRIQSEGEPVQIMRQGDTIWVPPGERHWHGGGTESAMTHVAVSLGTTTWGGEVSEIEYVADVD